MRFQFLLAIVALPSTALACGPNLLNCEEGGFLGRFRSNAPTATDVPEEEAPTPAPTFVLPVLTPTPAPSNAFVPTQPPNSPEAPVETSIPQPTPYTPAPSYLIRSISPTISTSPTTQTPTDVFTPTPTLLTPTNPPGNGQVTCVCDGLYSLGDRVEIVRQVDWLQVGDTGVVACGGNSNPPLLVRWDGATRGHNGNPSACECPTGARDALRNNTRSNEYWYVQCENVRMYSGTPIGIPTPFPTTPPRPSISPRPTMTPFPFPPVFTPRPTPNVFPTRSTPYPSFYSPTTIAPQPNFTIPNITIEECDIVALFLEITFDDFPEEISWTFYNDRRRFISRSPSYAGKANEKLMEFIGFFPTEVYNYFEIRDSWGDGIFAPGGYTLFVARQDGTQSIIGSGASFGRSNYYSVYENTPAGCGLPEGPYVVPTSCDEVELYVELQLDNNPSSIKWELANLEGRVFYTRQYYRRPYELVLEHLGSYPVGETYVFGISDSIGDGLIGDAYYKVFYVTSDANVTSVAEGGQFGRKEKTTFTTESNCFGPTPPINVTLECFEAYVYMNLKLDGYPEETRWEFYDSRGRLVKSSPSYGGKPNEVVFEGLGIINANEYRGYRLVVYDSWGDGLTNAGGLELFMLHSDGESELISSSRPTSSSRSYYIYFQPDPSCVRPPENCDNVMLYLEVQYGSVPVYDVNWDLRDVSSSYRNQSGSVYGSTGQSVISRIGEIDGDKDYTFTMRTGSSGGLGNDGFYKVFYVDSTGNITFVVDGGEDLGYKEKTNFTAVSVCAQPNVTVPVVVPNISIACNEAFLYLNLLLDGFPEETSWELFDPNGYLIATSPSYANRTNEAIVEFLGVVSSSGSSGSGNATADDDDARFDDADRPEHDNFHGHDDSYADDDNEDNHESRGDKPVRSLQRGGGLWYSFVIRDEWGDGLRNPGFFELFYINAAGERVDVASGGRYISYQEYNYFQVEPTRGCDVLRVPPSCDLIEVYAEFEFGSVPYDIWWNLRDETNEMMVGRGYHSSYRNADDIVLEYIGSFSAASTYSFGISDSLDEGAGSSVYFDLFYVDFEGVRQSVTRRGVVDGKVKTSFTPGWLCSLGVDMEVAMNVHP